MTFSFNHASLKTRAEYSNLPSQEGYIFTVLLVFPSFFLSFFLNHRMGETWWEDKQCAKEVVLAWIWIKLQLQGLKLKGSVEPCQR